MPDIFDIIENQAVKCAEEKNKRPF